MAELEYTEEVKKFNDKVADKAINLINGVNDGKYTDELDLEKKLRQIELRLHILQMLKDMEMKDMSFNLVNSMMENMHNMDFSQSVENLKNFLGGVK